MFDENRYDVFLSYAHKDVEGHPERERYLVELKRGIERLAGKPLVFLDSESILPGETWNSKIMMGIHSCKVFLCLLSKNYLESEYCKREYLWWCQKELQRGRIRKMTLPVYYVRFPEDIEDVASSSRLADELLSFQIGGDARPWFGEGEDSFKEELVRERLEGVVARTNSFLEANKNEELSFCSIRLYNRAFVGRLAELRRLWDICRTDRYPVLHANGGVGKTELAVAYAYGFADEYPQGRFAVPMEGVTSWQEALDRLVDREETDPDKPEQTVAELFGIDHGCLPREPSERKRIIWSTIKDRAQQGPLLLLLDNLDDMSLLSPRGLEKLDRRGIPRNVHLIVTTRNTPDLSCTSRFVSLEIGNLDDDAAVELLRRYGKDAPFNIDKPSEDDVELKAAKDIARLLENHAWSLEIVGGDVGENWRRGMTFTRKLESLTADFSVKGKDHNEDVQSAEGLLGQTFSAIARSECGDEALELLKVASVFPTDGIPTVFLEKYFAAQCKGEFELALDVLRRYHLISCVEVSDEQPIPKNSYLRMHRLTNAVMARKFADCRMALCERVHAAIFQYLKNVSTRFIWSEYSKTERLLLAAKPLYAALLEAGGDEYSIAFVAYMWRLGQVQYESGHYLDADMTLSEARDAAEKIPGSESGKLAELSSAWHCLGRVKNTLRQEELAVTCYETALSFKRELIKKDRDKWLMSYGVTLSNISLVYRFLHRYADAKRCSEEAVEVARECAERDRAKYLWRLASFLASYGDITYTLGAFGKAMEILLESLGYYRELLEGQRDVVLPKYAYLLTCLGDVCKAKCDLDGAEKYYAEALDIRREIALVERDANMSSLAAALTNLGNVHYQRKDYEKDEALQLEALSLRRELVRRNQNIYNPGLAAGLNDLACVQKARGHFKEAEQSWLEAVDIRRTLVSESRQPYLSGLALSLSNLGNVQWSLRKFEQAEESYREALALYRENALDNRNFSLANLARALGLLGYFLCCRHRYGEAERLLLESIEIRRGLMAKDPDAYSQVYAYACDNLGSYYYSIGDYRQAENVRSEQLSVLRHCAEKNRQASLPDLAGALTAKGNLRNHVRGDFDSTMPFYEEALSIRRELFAKDPSAFKAGLASLLDCIGDACKFSGRFEAAENNYAECLKLRRELVEESRETYLAGLSVVLRDYGELKRLICDMDGSGAMLSEALKYDRELMECDRISNLWGLSESLRRIGDLNLSVGRLDDAEDAIRESVAGMRELASDSPMRHEVYLARSLAALGNVLKAKGGSSLEAFAEARELASKYPSQRIAKDVLNDLPTGMSVQEDRT